MISVELKKRITTAAILVVVVAGILVLGSYYPSLRWGYLFLSFLLALVATVELASMSGRWWYLLVLGVPLVGNFALASGLGAFSIDQTWLLGLALPLGWGTVMVITCIAGLIWYSREELLLGATVAIELFFSVLLIGFGGLALMSLCVLEGAPKILAWLIIVVCSNDIAAYFAGRKFGVMKLAPGVSPGKTVVGSVAGIVVGVLLGWAFSGWLFSSGVFVAPGVVIAAQLGDLSKSYVKRLNNTKDSSGLLPGHGGVLDRIDGILLASPVLLSACLLERLL